MARKRQKLKWTDMPEEMQQMVVDKMDRKTNCKFMICSKKSDKQARRSPNIPISYEIKQSEEHKKRMLKITLEDPYPDYWYEFLEVEGEPEMTIVNYKIDRGQNEEYVWDLKWSKMVDGKPDEIWLMYLKEHIEKYKYWMTDLRIGKIPIQIGDFSIKNLKNLGHLKIWHCFHNIPHEHVTNFIDIQQLLKIRRLRIRGINFSFDQIFNFKGTYLIVSSNDFTKERIVEYLRMLKNGEKFIDVLAVFLRKSEFIEAREITEGLDIFDFASGEDEEEEEDWCFFKFKTINGQTYDVDFKSNGYFEVALSHEIVKIASQ